MMQRMNELAFYTLAGAPDSPRELIAEVQRAEALGLGSAFISERFNIKEAATLSGAVGAVSTEIGIATAATNHSTDTFAGTWAGEETGGSAPRPLNDNLGRVAPQRRALA